MITLRNVAVLIFADTPPLAAAARAAAADLRLAKARIEVRDGGMDAAREWLGSHRSPDVLIVGDSADAGILERLESLAEVVEPGCKVIVAGRRDSIALFRELTARGIGDYVGGAVSGTDLVHAILRLFALHDQLPKGKVLVVTGAAGGAGTSTVAAIVADELAHRMNDALLVDLDLHMGVNALSLALDVRDSLADAMANAGLDVAMLERFVVRDRGLRVLSTHGSLRAVASFDGDVVERVVTLARSIAKMVVIDLPKGWSEAHARLLTLADEVAVVTTPDLAALRNSRMMLDELGPKRADAPRPKVVLNKAGFAKGKEYAGADFREALGGDLAATIPWDPLPLMTAMVEGKSVTDAGGKAVAAVRGFAANLFPARESPTRKSRHVSSMFRGLFEKFA